VRNQSGAGKVLPAAFSDLFRFLNLKSENLSLRVLSGKQIDDLLDRSVGFFISGLEFAGRSVAWCGFTVEEAVGQWATDALVEENEHEGDTGPFIGEPVGVTGAVALQ
jgi:hypothetical protein